MSENNSPSDKVKGEKVVEFSDFLETFVPYRSARILLSRSQKSAQTFNLLKPTLRLHCENDECGGTRFFSTQNFHLPIELAKPFPADFNLLYYCKNCNNSKKSYALRVSEENGFYKIVKYGELPMFGPVTPPKLISMIGAERETFLKGRRCEAQGLGIAAFIYYRRVVENQKEKILSEIGKVLEKTGEDPAVVELLKRASRESQFKKALEMAKPAIPKSLEIDGHNPLGLLYQALSEGVHSKSDEECLEIAGSVRLILADLCERIAQALREEADLKKAISSIMNRKSSEASPPPVEADDDH